MNQELLKKYNLKEFEFILDAIMDWAGDLHGLDGKSILELGPGTRLNLLKFFQNETAASLVCAAGKTISRKQESVHAIYLYPYVKAQKSNSFDLLYSRHLFEANSIHPFLLITHPAYWKTIRENRFDNPGVDFPSSISNMQAIFVEAYRILKPGGLIFSQIAKRKNSALTDTFLDSLKPKPRKIERTQRGKYSETVSILK